MRILSLLFSILILTSVSHAKRGPAPGGWYIGFGLGSGVASITLDSGAGEKEKDYDEFFELVDGGEVDSARVSVSIEGGIRIAPRYLLGIHVAGINQVGEEGGLKLSVGHSQALGVLTFFPSRKDLFIRGGLGAATVNVTTDISATNTRIRLEERGTGIMLGAGIALPISPSARFTLTLDFHGAQFDSAPGAPTEATFGVVQLGVTWY